MDYGLKNRLSRIIKPKDNRTVMLAIDHGYFMGPTSGLEDIKSSIVPLLPYADSLMLTRGILRSQVDAAIDIPIVLRVSGGTSILKDDLSDEDIAVSMEDAIRLNASAVALSIFIGSKNERQGVINLARLVDKGNRYGIPVLAVTAVGREMTRDARYLSLAVRIAAEMGASIVKTYYCDDFERVVDTCPVPVIVAGGKKTGEKQALELAYNAVKNGAAGVDMGRNIFQSGKPINMIMAVRAVVHDGLTAEEAYGTKL
ncbi:MAG: 3-hydroxy-5-phosphonooxypentane-2,4-dione thiolase [Deltaproteobacteria bacterium]|nr:3-hydroxy-5-phosphonooxypentane-2,4-dione thiolase [Deltaproteobacteria bacterium]